MKCDFLKELLVQNEMNETCIQPWESAVAFGNAVVNVVNLVKVFAYAVLFFRFYSVADNS